jgi:hypothetical protein
VKLCFTLGEAELRRHVGVQATLGNQVDHSENVTALPFVKGAREDFFDTIPLNPSLEKGEIIGFIRL